MPFGMPKAFTVRLENVGATPARFYFVAPPKLRESEAGGMVWDDNQPLCPPWLVISQEEGELQPGEQGRAGCRLWGLLRVLASTPHRALGLVSSQRPTSTPLPA